MVTTHGFKRLIFSLLPPTTVGLPSLDDLGGFLGRPHRLLTGYRDIDLDSCRTQTPVNVRERVWGMSSDRIWFGSADDERL